MAGIRTILMFITWAIAFCWGFGWITWPWLAACFLMGWARGVLFAGERIPQGDFQQQSDPEFRQSSRLVWMSTLLTILPIGIWGGIGKGLSLLIH